MTSRGFGGSQAPSLRLRTRPCQHVAFDGRHLGYRGAPVDRGGQSVHRSKAIAARLTRGPDRKNPDVLRRMADMMKIESPRHDSVVKPRQERILSLSESVQKVHAVLQSLRSISRMDAKRRNAIAVRLRFSKSSASRRHRPNHPKTRSTVYLALPPRSKVLDKELQFV